MTRFALLPFLILTACDAWPDVGGPTLSRDGRDWPTLLPLSGIIDTGSVEAATDEDAARLAARAAALRSRAQVLRSDASDREAMEALRARLKS